MKVLVLGRIKAGVFFKPGRPQLTLFLFLFVLQEGVGENKRQLAACLYCLYCVDCVHTLKLSVTKG